MKSIKEKSVEHLNSVYAGYDDVLKKLVKEGYVSGANYVLEQVENIVLDKNTGLVEMWSELMTLIKQLKE